MSAEKQPIALNHPDYDASLDRWQRCRDACGGQDYVKAETTKYLPALSSHTEGLDGGDEYAGYLDRALYYNMVKRTMTGLSGAATLQPVKIEKPTFEQDAKGLAKIAKTIVDEQFLVSRIAIGVTQTKEGDTGFTLWWAENIVNWRWRRDTKTSKNVLTMVVLESVETEDKTDSFESVEQTIRHGYIIIDGVCNYESWKKGDDDKWVQVDERKPISIKGGATLDHIPVKILGALEEDPTEVEDPILGDLVDVNLSHYQNSADLEHGRHWTALPTAWASGFPTKDVETGESVEFICGGRSAWITEVPGAQAGYLEFAGSGLGHLADGMREKQAMAAVLGARLLEEAKASVESAETIKTRLVGERSVLSRVASTTSQGLTWALQEMVMFQRPAYEVGSETDNLLTLNTDFMDKAISPGQLSALVGALQNNAISYQTFFYYLQNAAVIPETTTLEEEEARINAGAPGKKEDPFVGAGAGDNPRGGGFPRF